MVVRVVFEEGCPGCKSGVWLTLGPKTCSIVIEITTYLIIGDVTERSIFNTFQSRPLVLTVVIEV